MSENLLSLPGLSVLAVNTNDSHLENKHASIPGLRLSGKGVNEVRKFGIQAAGTPVWAEHFMDCVGSIVVAQKATLMTHHFGDYLVERMGIFQAIGDLQREVYQVDGGVAVIWRKAFTDRAEDKSYKEAAKMWYQMLAKLYLDNTIAVYDMVFRDWEWPLSAYYDGHRTLNLVANVNDYEKLIQPEITQLK